MLGSDSTRGKHGSSDFISGSRRPVRSVCMRDYERDYVSRRSRGRWHRNARGGGAQQLPRLMRRLHPRRAAAWVLLWGTRDIGEMRGRGSERGGGGGGGGTRRARVGGHEWTGEAPGVHARWVINTFRTCLTQDGMRWHKTGTCAYVPPIAAAARPVRLPPSHRQTLRRDNPPPGVRRRAGLNAGDRQAYPGR